MCSSTNVNSVLSYFKHTTSYTLNSDSVIVGMFNNNYVLILAVARDTLSMNEVDVDHRVLEWPILC